MKLKECVVSSEIADGGEMKPMGGVGRRKGGDGREIRREVRGGERRRG